MYTFQMNIDSWEFKWNDYGWMDGRIVIESLILFFISHEIYLKLFIYLGRCIVFWLWNSINGNELGFESHTHTIELQWNSLRQEQGTWVGIVERWANSICRVIYVNLIKFASKVSIVTRLHFLSVLLRFCYVIYWVDLNKIYIYKSI